MKRICLILFFLMLCAILYFGISAQWEIAEVRMYGVYYHSKIDNLMTLLVSSLTSGICTYTLR